MAKSLSERIAERSKKKSPSRNAQNRAAFLAIREDIKQALDDGWPVKSIWETLHEEGKVTFSYQAFRGYVNRLILTNKSKSVSVVALNQHEKNEQVTIMAKQKSAEVPGFTFMAHPDKEDLL